MKVLFAVNNEEISEAVVKKYQSEYKQIISYKNVYYFNAILKEIQKDKTYDRIVISEDLESFSHTQYDQIDKFIFDKLDSISDEASSARGEDIPIIVICSDRRTKSEQMLVKMFGIGIYNAILGTDRSVEEVCKLINQPRTKKEAKQYYKIDSDEVRYQAENENDVSEVEIQNILTHYKKLGKDENKFLETFDNIAAQYNDTQLRIISKFLPLNVRAVLEEKSPKYQQIMTFNNSVSDSLRQGRNQNESEGPSSTLLKSSTRNMPMSKPVVIPSAVNMSNVKKLAKNPRKEIENKPAQQQDGQRYVQQHNEYNNQQPIVRQARQETNTSQAQPVQQIQTAQPIQRVQPEPGINQMPKQQVVSNVEPISNINDSTIEVPDIEDLAPVSPVKRGRGRPRKNPDTEPQENRPKRGRGRPRKNQEVEIQEQQKNTNNNFDMQEEENLLPGFEDLNDTSFDTNQTQNYSDSNKVSDVAVLPGFEDLDELEDLVNQNNANMQGTQVSNNNSYNQPNNEPEEEDNLLPGFEELNSSDINDNFNQNSYNDFNVNNNTNVNTNINNGYQDFSSETEEENILPGFDDISDDISNNDYNMNNYQQNNNSFENDYNYNQPIEPIAEPVQENTQSGYVVSDTNQEDNSYNQDDDFFAPKVEKKKKEYINSIDLSSLLTPDKKIVSFLGTSKNGTSFIVNNIAELMSSMGISTAILDTTSNRNSYYIYTKNEEELRTTAAYTLDNLVRGNAQGIQVNKNLSVFTSLPDDSEKIEQVDEILETLVKNYSLVLIDTDFDTPIGYFKQSQETYLVQSLDILTIQPLTAFLRELKAKNILDESKLRIIINKAVRVKGISEKTIIGGMAFYNDPAMSFMTELFDRNLIKYITIPFEIETYTRYLENVINCEITLKGYSKIFMQSLKELANMIYPLISGGNSKQGYVPPSAKTNANGGFSPSINSTLDQMKRNY